MKTILLQALFMGYILVDGIARNMYGQCCMEGRIEKGNRFCLW